MFLFSNGTSPGPLPRSRGMERAETTSKKSLDSRPLTSGREVAEMTESVFTFLSRIWRWLFYSKVLWGYKHRKGVYRNVDKVSETPPKNHWEVCSRFHFTCQITLNFEYLSQFFPDRKVLWMTLEQLCKIFMKFNTFDCIQAIFTLCTWGFVNFRSWGGNL